MKVLVIGSGGREHTLVQEEHMDGTFIVAVIGAAAWLPQIISWIANQSKRLVANTNLAGRFMGYMV
ncbi:MAG: hypothetical protein HYY56_00970 [Candidatus Omnitrophica bacterium]|nr:hypothetical protein [Candidatus Omnitrophota bacterium]